MCRGAEKGSEPAISPIPCCMLPHALSQFITDVGRVGCTGAGNASGAGDAISMVGRSVHVTKVPHSSPVESIDGIWNCRVVADAIVDGVDVLPGRNWLAVLWCYEGVWLRPFLPLQPEKKFSETRFSEILCR